LTCTPGAHGTTPTSCNVNQTYGGATIAGGAVTGVEWDWGDGTTADNSSTTPVKTHQYVNAGTYTVIATVTANTTNGSQTGTSSKSVVVP
jgi:PKD repeat protein